jgi:hypothetical protein
MNRHRSVEPCRFCPFRGEMTREEKIYMAYKTTLVSKRRENATTAEILAMIHTAKVFKISLFTMLDIAKRRGKTRQ